MNLLIPYNNATSMCSSISKTWERYNGALLGGNESLLCAFTSYLPTDWRILARGRYKNVLQLLIHEIALVAFLEATAWNTDLPPFRAKLCGGGALLLLGGTECILLKCHFKALSACTKVKKITHLVLPTVALLLQAQMNGYMAKKSDDVDGGTITVTNMLGFIGVQTIIRGGQMAVTGKREEERIVTLVLPEKTTELDKLRKEKTEIQKKVEILNMLFLRSEVQKVFARYKKEYRELRVTRRSAPKIEGDSDEVKCCQLRIELRQLKHDLESANRFLQARPDLKQALEQARVAGIRPQLV